VNRDIENVFFAEMLSSKCLHSESDECLPGILEHFCVQPSKVMDIYPKYVTSQTFMNNTVGNMYGFYLVCISVFNHISALRDTLSFTSKRSSCANIHEIIEFDQQNTK